MSRAAWMLPLTILALGFAPGSEDGDASEQARLVQPKVAIAIEHIPGTGDLVQMSFQGPIYDEATLIANAEALAKSVGGTVASFQFLPSYTESEPNKAMFVTQNLLDPSMGDIRLQPVVRAFMKGLTGRVDSFSVRIMGMRPTSYTTLAAYSSPEVALRAFYDAATPSIEYRILVMSDDPASVEIPPRHIPTEVYTGDSDSSSPALPLIVGLLILAGGSAGALVYFALLGKRA